MPGHGNTGGSSRLLEVSEPAGGSDMREDIYGGLKNALEKGVNLEKAVRSFISAGYNESEVREAANVLSSGQFVSSQTSGNERSWPLQKEDQNMRIPENLSPATRAMAMPSKKEINRVRGGVDYTLIILGTILFLLVIFLISSLLFKDQIISFFNGLF